MDFFISLIVGLFFGGWIGLAVASLITISRDKENETELDNLGGVDDVIADTIAELKKQQSGIEEQKSKQMLTFNFGSLDELRKRQQERLDSEAWQEDMERDAQLYEAGE